jgi:hypothetical protein
MYHVSGSQINCMLVVKNKYVYIQSKDENIFCWHIFSIQRLWSLVTCQMQPWLHDVTCQTQLDVHAPSHKLQKHQMNSQL